MTAVAGRPPGGRRVVVLGGTGFLGRHVTAGFAGLGDRVVVVARRPDVRSAHRTVPVDLVTAHPGVLAELLDVEQPDVLVDTTGSSWGLAEAEMAGRCRQVSENVLSALASSRCRPRMVHVGTMMEYGPPDGHGAPTPPRTAYGAAKLAAARGVLAATTAGHVNGIVLRMTNLIGPGLPGNSLLGRVAAALLPVLRDGGAAEVVLWPMRARRDVLDVRDAVQAVLAATTCGAHGEVVDVGRGEAVPVRDLVELLLEVSGVRARVVEEEPDLPEWRAIVDLIRVDPGRAVRLLGWAPRYTPREAVQSFWQATVETAETGGRPPAADPSRCQR